MVIHGDIHGLVNVNRGYPWGYPRTNQSEPWLSMGISTAIRSYPWRYPRTNLSEPSLSMGISADQFPLYLQTLKYQPINNNRIKLISDLNIFKSNVPSTILQTSYLQSCKHFLALGPIKNEDNLGDEIIIAILETSVNFLADTSQKLVAE